MGKLITKETITFEIEDWCEAIYDWDSNVDLGTWTFGEPYLKSVLHGIGSNANCMEECGMHCQAISKKYYSHTFEKGAEPKLIRIIDKEWHEYEAKCYENKCSCTCT